MLCQHLALDDPAFGWAYSRIVPVPECFFLYRRELASYGSVFVRILFVVLLASVCYFLHPFGMTGWMGASAGAAAAGAVIVFEFRVRALSLRRLIGALVGSITGIFGAALFCLVLRSAPLNTSTSAVLQIFVLLLMTYVGLLVGATKGDLLNPAALGNRVLERPAAAAECEGAGHERHHRWADRRYCRGGLYRRDDGGAGVCAEGTADCGRLDRRVEAAKGPAGPGHAAADAVEHQHPGTDCSGRLSVDPGGGSEAAGAGEEVGKRRW